MNDSTKNDSGAAPSGVGQPLPPKKRGGGGGGGGWTENRSRPKSWEVKNRIDAT